MGLELGDGVEQAVGRARDPLDRADAQARVTGVVAADDSDLGEVVQRAVSFIAGDLVLDRDGELVGVGGFENAAGDLGCELGVGQVAELVDGAPEGLALRSMRCGSRSANPVTEVVCFMRRPWPSLEARVAALPVR